MILIGHYDYIIRLLETLKSTKMGKSEHRKILIDFFNWYNDNPKEFSNNETIVDAYIDSHSPTETEFNTLQEGDWFEGSPDQYRKVLEFEGTLKEDAYDDFIEDCVNHGMVWQTEFGNGYIDNLTCYFKTQLTPEEFLRRAENTFKPIPPKLKYITDGQDPH